MTSAEQFPSDGRGRCLCGEVRTSGNPTRMFDNGRVLVRCASCGLLRLWPPPVHGNDDNSIYSDPAYLASIDEAEYYGYFRALFDRALAPLLSSNTRILDFGAGSCHYQYFLERLGFQAVSSVEVNPHLVRYAREHLGLTRVHSSLGELRGRFDLIYSNQVLEHLFDPWSLLHGALLDVLAPGGYLVFSVPNAASLNRLLLGRRWIGWSPAEHIWFFEESSVRRLFAKSPAYEIVRIQVKSAVNTPDDSFRPSSFPKRLYYGTAMRLFEWLGRGDQLIVTLRERSGVGQRS